MVELDRADSRRAYAGDDLAERRLAGAGWTYDAEAFAGCETERHALQHQMARPREGSADIVDDKAALRPFREVLGVRGPRDGGHDAVEPQVGRARRRKGLPARHRAFDRCERTSEQQAGGKDDARTSELFEHERGGGAHDQRPAPGPHGFGDQHDDLAATLGQFVLTPRIPRGLLDQSRSAIEHSHGFDHVDVPDSDAETSVAPGERRDRPRQRACRDEVAGEPETEHDKRRGRADHPEQRMHEEKHQEEKRRPEHIEQHRACAGLGELAQGRKGRDTPPMRAPDRTDRHIRSTRRAPPAEACHRARRRSGPVRRGAMRQARRRPRRQTQR